ncbi:hypothetical protein ASY01nite_20250 [Acetobacter syzygii]|nr:hypothetical protein ASY01nite_20250 [Acetobacter syzygii]
MLIWSSNRVGIWISSAENSALFSNVNDSGDVLARIRSLAAKEYVLPPALMLHEPDKITVQRVVKPGSSKYPLI